MEKATWVVPRELMVPLGMFSWLHSHRVTLTSCCDFYFDGVENVRA